MPIRHKYKSLRLHVSVGAIALALITTSPVAAEETAAAPAAEAASGDGLLFASEILVTARRREERAQDVPIALSVVGAETLARTGTFTISQVQQLVPMICPRLSGPKTMIVWTTKGTRNAEQEAQAGRDYRQAA